MVNLYTEDSTGRLVKVAGKSLGVDVNYPLSKKTYFSGGSGLSSTVYDYAVFLQMLLNGGQYNGKRLLSRNSVRMMTMNQIGNIDFGDDKFGLGFSIVTEKAVLLRLRRLALLAGAALSALLTGPTQKKK